MPALSEQAALRARTGWLIAGALIGAVAVGVPWLLQARTSRPGRVVDLGPVDAFTSATPYPPILNARDDFYLVQKAPGEFLAFYAYPTVVRRDRPACTVIWMPMFEFDGQVGFFRDGCFGATYKLDGTRVFGPAFRPLDQFRVEVNGGRLLVDTRRLICNGSGPCARVE